jgi:hypothetical protein
MKLFQRLFKPPFQSDMPIVFAFEVGGTKYYQFDDAFNTPCERALAALPYYRELDMRCTREYLLKHTEAVTELLTGTKVNLEKLGQLNVQLKDRLNMIFEPDIAYKLASVVYFDKSESPYQYDFKYARKKIAHWKKHKGVHDFFLQMPLQKLIPFLSGVEMNLDIFSEVAEKMNRIHSAVISSISSSEGKVTG